MVQFTRQQVHNYWRHVDSLTVVPRGMHGGNDHEPELLESCYRNCFNVALEQGDIKTIAFPGISTGVYGYPKDNASQIAVRVMKEYEQRFEKIIACVFNVGDAGRYQALLGKGI